LSIRDIPHDELHMIRLIEKAYASDQTELHGIVLDVNMVNKSWKAVRADVIKRGMR
jgi:hypothetical protein